MKNIIWHLIQNLFYTAICVGGIMAINSIGKADDSMEVGLGVVGIIIFICGFRALVGWYVFFYSIFKSK